jgi:serine/threonine-protein kinase
MNIATMRTEAATGPVHLHRPELAKTVAAPLPSVHGDVPVPPSAGTPSVLPRVELDAAGVHLVPTKGPRYERVRTLGAGGMGEVALVEDRDIGRSVAMKRLLPVSNGAGALARFVDEVRIVGKLEHPNIVPIHDVGVDDKGEYFFVMKYVEGETLEEILERLRTGDPLAHRMYDFARRVEIFVGVLRALQYAHDRGIVHRDVKPANVMVGHFGEVLLMDWGVAKPVSARDLPPESVAPPTSLGTGDEARASSTHAGHLVGTPSYMSPEQASGRNDALDARSDLYSACVLFHEILGLRHRHEGIDNLAHLVAMIGTTDAPTARTMFDTHPAQDAAVPADLAHFLHKGLRLKPEDRWQSAEEMILELHAILDGRCRIQCPITFMKRSSREISRQVDRNPMRTWFLAAVAVVFFVAMMVFAVKGVIS